MSPISCTKAPTRLYSLLTSMSFLAKGSSSLTKTGYRRLELPYGGVFFSAFVAFGVALHDFDPLNIVFGGALMYTL